MSLVEVFASINKDPKIVYPVLVPNLQGLETAIAAGVKCIAVFLSASETFSQNNINCSIVESYKRVAELMPLAKKHNIMVRGYISCVIGCPFEGEVPINQVVNVAIELANLGCYEISLGDTIGIGTPLKAKKVFNAVAAKVAINSLAAHFHDTYGQALTNIYAVMEEGISIIDSSISGLGGCPYAVGATGNVATEDVVYMLDGMGITTGVNMQSLLNVSKFVSQTLGHKVRSKVAKAMLSKL